MLVLAMAFIFLTALILCTYWHMRQNRMLSRHWQQQLDRETAEWMNQFAWSRSIQLLVAITSGLLALLMLYSWELQGAGAQLNAVNAGMANMQARLEEVLKAQQQLQQNQQQLADVVQQAAANPPPSPVAPVAAPRIPQARIPSVAVTAEAVPSYAYDAAGEYRDDAAFPPEPDKQAFLPPEGAVPDLVIGEDGVAREVDRTGGEWMEATPVGIDEIYNPEETASDKQSEMDAIKKRYEGLLVNYLFLKKCELINPQDYHTIISTLARELSSINAPSRMEHDILTAAQGSYNEMYSQSQCDAQETQQLYQQYTDYIRTISEHIPAN